mgnify:CR=1 FL=1
MGYANTPSIKILLTDFEVKEDPKWDTKGGSKRGDPKGVPKGDPKGIQRGVQKSLWCKNGVPYFRE